MARQVGALSQANKDVKELLDSNKVAIITRAIALATDKKAPNIELLKKLIDKILPSLTMTDFKGEMKEETKFTQLTDNDLKSLVTSFAKYAAKNVKD